MRLDLTGHRFGKLIAINIVENDKKGTYWHCKCDCGKTNDVFIGHLRSGRIRSCGCLISEINPVIPNNVKHGRSRSDTHISWCAMRSRVLNKTTNGFRNYGGKGIKICERWENFSDFLQDMGERPSKDYVLDRINPNGNYEPNNCRWITKEKSALNKTNSKIWVVKGKQYNSSKEAAKANNVSMQTIRLWCCGGMNNKKYVAPRKDCFSKNRYEN